jgi:nucleoside-diphosphate-sugar epimerase
LEKPFELYGADSIRDFLNAEDIADIIIEMAKKKPCGVFNIASGKGMKIRDFVQSMTKKKLKIKALGNKDILVANVDKLNRLLNE